MAAIDRETGARDEIIVDEEQHRLGNVLRAAFTLDEGRPDGLESLGVAQVGGRRTGPGAMQLTRTRGLRVPSSTARQRVSVGIAPLETK